VLIQLQIYKKSGYYITKASAAPESDKRRHVIFFAAFDSKYQIVLILKVK